MQAINASLLHLTTPENENKGRDKGNANEDENSLFCLSLVWKFKRIPTSLKSTLQLNILKTINDMEFLVQQNIQQDNMAHQMPSQQQYGHVVFQNRYSLILVNNSSNSSFINCDLSHRLLVRDVCFLILWTKHWYCKQK